MFEGALYKDTGTVKAKRLSQGVWLIQSRTFPDLLYRVDANIPECQCKYFEFHPSCPHILKVTELEKLYN